MKYILLLLNALLIFGLMSQTSAASGEYISDEEYANAYVAGYNQGCLDMQLDFQESYGVKFDGDSRWYTDGDLLFNIEECIDRSRFAANSHAALAYKHHEDVEHNIYWMNVHNSCAYHLEKYMEVQE